MTNRQIDAIIMKDLHPQAERRVIEYTSNFSFLLLLQAKIQAHQQRADVVLSSHIDEARDIIMNRRQKQAWRRELVKIVGGSLLGVFVKGFITELSKGGNLLIAVYAGLGIIGMLLVVWSLRR